jgi:squalene cyclase
VNTRNVYVSLSITALLLSVISLCLIPDARAQQPPKINDAVSPSTRSSINRALEYLKTQQHQDGSFGQRGYHLANSSLAGLAFLGAGNGYNRGRYGEQLAKILNYILRCQDKWGYIDDSQCRMHGHGYATLFLAEIYGMLPPELQKKVQKALQNACKVIATSQTREGGWGYHPSHIYGYQRYMSDEGSITITVVQALRAARNGGINVKKSIIQKGIKYIQRCMTEQGCRYTLNSSRRTYTLTAAAVSVLNASGVYQSKELNMGLRFMRKRIAGVGNPLDASEWPWYGNLYAVQAMWQSGGKDWESFYPRAYEHLLRTQRADGSWSGARGGWGSGYGDTFSTSIGALMLETPLGYLPIFER